jgi:hypothetical protein
VDKYKDIPPYHETRQYVRRIVHDYNRRKEGAAKAKDEKKSSSAQGAERAASQSRRTMTSIE